MEILGLMCITCLSVNATPLLYLRDKMGLLDIKDSNHFLKNRLIELLSCPMCIGFWIGIIVTQDIYISAIVAIGSEILNKILLKDI